MPGIIIRGDWKVVKQFKEVEMKRFICWYAYRGHETEGSLDIEEPQIITAESVAEAIWTWQTKHRNVDMIGIHGSYEAFLAKENFTGWGIWCEELAK